MRLHISNVGRIALGQAVRYTVRAENHLRCNNTGLLHYGYSNYVGRMLEYQMAGLGQSRCRR
jgi:hypothetical protein